MFRNYINLSNITSNINHYFERMDHQQEKTKARSKNYSQEEINTLVDMVQENKSRLFGSLSASLTYEEKSSIWDQIANDLTTKHGVDRSRDDVTKKWSNILCKHKPLIADKIKSVRKTGGGPAEAELTYLEEKIHSIRGKETFEGISCGIDVSAEPQSSHLSGQMLISPSVSFDAEDKQSIEKGIIHNWQLLILMRQSVFFLQKRMRSWYF